MRIKNISQYEPIVLYKKNIPNFYFENKFDKKCELIKIDHSYYGHIIGSRNVTFVVTRLRLFISKGL